jgi:hypothetical protein
MVAPAVTTDTTTVRSVVQVPGATLKVGVATFQA